MVDINRTYDIKDFKSSEDLFNAATINFGKLAKRYVNENGVFNVVLLGGNTAKYFFDTLANMEEDIPWNKIQFFFGDERYVAHSDKQSNYHTAYEHLFKKKNTLKKNIHPIPTNDANPEDAAKKYESIIKDKTFDLVYLGLGEDGHTASLMPHCLIHTDHQNQLVAALWVPSLNMYRITLTPEALNNSREIHFLVPGSNKSAAIQAVLKGPYLPEQYPAQLIQCQHGKTIWYLTQGEFHETNT